MKEFKFRLRLYATNTFWGVVGPPRRLYWRLFHPKTRGVKLVITHADEVLLVRINYGHKQWSFPGGGVAKNEDWKSAALREAYEETGLLLADAEKIGEYLNTKEHKIDTVQVFKTALHDKLEPRADRVEIAEVGWFALDQLPANRVPRVDQIISTMV